MNDDDTCSSSSSVGDEEELEERVDMAMPENTRGRARVDIYASRTESRDLRQLFLLDDDTERAPWLNRLILFMELNKSPLKQCTVMDRTPLDLYRLYALVQSKGGYLEVSDHPTQLIITSRLSQTTPSCIGVHEQRVVGDCRPAGDQELANSSPKISIHYPSL